MIKLNKFEKDSLNKRKLVFPSNNYQTYKSGIFKNRMRDSYNISLSKNHMTETTNITPVEINSYQSKNEKKKLLTLTKEDPFQIKIRNVRQISSILYHKRVNKISKQIQFQKNSLPLLFPTQKNTIYNSNQKTLKEKFIINKQIHHAHANTENKIVFSNEDSKMTILKKEEENEQSFLNEINEIFNSFENDDSNKNNLGKVKENCKRPDTSYSQLRFKFNQK